MSNKRQKLTRRDFLRIAGLAGASLTVKPAANLSTQNSKTSLGSIADPAGRPARPWWVRLVDQPTIQVDWDRVQRFNAQDTVRGVGFSKYIGSDEVNRLNTIAAGKEKARILGNITGYSLKDQALNAAQRHEARRRISFLGPRNVETPEEREVPKWEGSSTDAARMLRVAMRHFGAATVGFVKLTDQTRRLIYSHDPDGKALAFEDVARPDETADKRVIPLTARWVIVYTVQMSAETLKRAPTVVAQQTTALSYTRGALIQDQTQEFIRGLGYQCLGQSSTNALGIAPAFAVLAGLGELSRLNRLITPEYGPMVRVFLLITDLPVATDQPIDAGIIEFCKHCKKCAEACPASALSLEDGPSWQVRGGWNNPGHQAYFEDSVACKTYMETEAGTNCGICFAVCPFSKPDKAWIHNWVKATVASAPALDGFIRSMDDALSYGAQKDSEDWWSLDLPEYGIDSERST